VPAVGQTPFRHLQTGHHFDAGNESLVKPSWKLEGMEHQATNAVADPRLTMTGLDMDVAGTQANGFVEDQMLDLQQRGLRCGNRSRPTTRGKQF
jgi:hypothetical protein